jgi:hypothetical protein
MPCLIALGLFAAAGVLIGLEIHRAPTMCSYCGSLECPGSEDCPGRATYVEVQALAKLDAAHDAQALEPWRVYLENL